jgi:hypothetical protein
MYLSEIVTKIFALFWRMDSGNRVIIPALFFFTNFILTHSPTATYKIVQNKRYEAIKSFSICARMYRNARNGKRKEKRHEAMSIENWSLSIDTEYFPLLWLLY